MTLRSAGAPNLLVPLNVGLLSAAAMAIGVLLVEMAPASAGTRDTEAPRATQNSTTKTPKTSEAKESTSTPLFASCKREAQGLRGPERATFMTNCLKERNRVSP